MASLLDDLDELNSEDEGDQLDPFASSAASSSGDFPGAAAAAASAAAASSNDEAGGAEHDHDMVDDDADDDADEDDVEMREGGAADAAASSSSNAAATAEAAAMEHPRDAVLEGQLDALSRGRTGYKVVARLRDTPRFKEHSARISAALAAPPAPLVGHLEEWPDYKLVLAANAVIANVDEELAALHRYVIAAYAPKFPEMASILPVPMEYLRVVRRIGNETDATLVDLGDLLPAAQAMVITVTSSTTAGKPLPPAALADVLAACDEAFALETAKAENLRFIESRLVTLAPNVTALLGAPVAAQLVGIAGGLTQLSRIPACNVLVLGAKKRALGGLARAASTPHAGVCYDCDIVASAPSAIRRRAARVLSNKIVLAARVDSFRERSDGTLGADFRAGLIAKITKWLAPPPGRAAKPLRAPDDKPSKRRGGRRHRALKQKLGMTDVRKEANRMTFAGPSGGGSDYGDVAMGHDTGMLGTAGSGKLRLERKAQKSLLGGAAGGKKRKLEMGGSSGATGGMASSLAFTPAQGLELANPAAAAERVRKANEDFAPYFEKSGTFTQIRKGT